MIALVNERNGWIQRASSITLATAGMERRKLSPALKGTGFFSAIFDGRGIRKGGIRKGVRNHCYLVLGAPLSQRHAEIPPRHRAPVFIFNHQVRNGS
jgi:hypothetical protein